MSKKQMTWLADVVHTLENLGGEAHYSAIYPEAEKVRKKRGATWPTSAKAIIRRTLEEQSSDTESFKGEDLFYSAKGIGSGSWGLRTYHNQKSDQAFTVGQLYNRQKDIHDKFGGNRQSGISSCKDHPYIFVFTGKVGETYGYSDGWDEGGVFRYFGEGQAGDMSFTPGNKAIRDHVVTGKDILLFENRGKGKPYKYIGQFDCIGYEFENTKDKHGVEREGIVFQLTEVRSGVFEADAENHQMDMEADVNELRKRAYSSVQPVKSHQVRDNKTVYRKRSEAIKNYVLIRSNGVCECCGTPAPFIKKNGTPYLEPHHIFKLSDSGIDHPRMVAAITPNCHREIHHGINGDQIDKRLARIIAAKEDDL